MRKYKLIKTYPNSPELGSFVVTNDNANEYLLVRDRSGKNPRFPIEAVENFPEYWQEIIEEFRILEFKWIKHINIDGDDKVGYKFILMTTDNLYHCDAAGLKYPLDFILNNGQFMPHVASGHFDIIKVQRITDNEVFEIGDKLKFISTKENAYRTISKFTVGTKQYPVLVHFEENEKYTAGFSLTLLNRYQKLPLQFIDPYGNKVYDTDDFFLVQKGSFQIMGPCVHHGFSTNIWIGFKNQEDAHKYIAEQTNVVLFKDYLGNDVYIFDRVFSVLPKAQWQNDLNTKEGIPAKHVVDTKMAGGAWIYFRNRTDAEEYIKLNKPMYCLNDIKEILKDYLSEAHVITSPSTFQAWIISRLIDLKK